MVTQDRGGLAGAIHACYSEHLLMVIQDRGGLAGAIYTRRSQQLLMVIQDQGGLTGAFHALGVPAIYHWGNNTMIFVQMLNTYA